MPLYLGSNQISRVEIAQNINWENIRLEQKSVNPSEETITYTPDDGYDVSSQFTVNAASLQTKTITPAQVEQSVAADTEYFGLKQVNVEAALLQSKTVTPTEEKQIITSDMGQYGLSQVTVNPIKVGNKTITENGVYTASSENLDGYKQVTVDVHGGGIEQLIKNDTSITPTGTYATSVYYDTSYGVKVGYMSNGDVMVSMENGTSSSYKTLRFTEDSLPSGVTLYAPESTSFSFGSNASKTAYCCIISGLTALATLRINMEARSSSYTTCAITVSYV